MKTQWADAVLWKIWYRIDMIIRLIGKPIAIDWLIKCQYVGDWKLGKQNVPDCSIANSMSGIGRGASETQ